MNGYKGLTSKEVIDSRKKYGNNKIDTFNKNSLLSLIIDSLNDPVIKILLIDYHLK